MKIGFPNYAFSETHELTVAGADVVAGVMANLRLSQGDQRVTVRGTGSGSVALHIQDLPPAYSGRTVQVVALIDVTVETVGTVTDLAWSVDVQGSTGGVTAEPVTVPEMPDGFPRHLLFLLDEPVTDCQLVRIYLDATGTGPIQVALTASALWVGPVTVLHALQEHGVALAANDAMEIQQNDTNQRSPGGQDYSAPGRGCRRHSGSSLLLNQVSVFGDGTSGVMDLQALQMAAGTARPILWLPDTSTPHMLHRTAIYGQFTSTGRIIRQQGKYRWENWGVLESR